MGYLMAICVLIHKYIKKSIIITMKKLLLVLAIGAFVACNDNASSSSNPDSTATTGDTMGTSVDTSMSRMGDTASSTMGRMADSAGAKIDSAK